MGIGERNWTIPNLLTIFRVLLTPVFVVLFMQERLYSALLTFGVAGLTDALDGAIARVLHQRSRLGAMLDPLADKILLVTSFVCLAIKGWIPDWLAVVVVSRDVIIVGGLAVLSFSGVDVKERIKPLMVSKVNTTAQMLLILAVLGGRAFFGNGDDAALILAQHVLVAIVAVLCVVSGAIYIFKWFGSFPADGKNGNGR
ncbi:CDP-diacylglycerol--glycerol-3-phosphate 3-phosphatidyltransferase [Desulfovibrio sulfodismutans]|uniref:CDP-diacylglycerol--glycerol-3-phosphate 3-phosphatidyltransferase n=1 Tax=Desulfolutivibrio sulfodismutans TaxID=63561 RepID=A0A7K3NJC0_9BACT|nr:CDP-alcohol phosphatidyltransferase family protein [Desulfolutivibrio sulfodismutans]NDY55903.1 CDP-diacylglycerol--glycerol-3-phosphate 3-phosphatidyltransferase [Desulfolutivibrio sulfodismutans]QLA11168.1 CDP-diacylglycerol--glycerol-3-phosphate 3-phosphatidyltransferase [Desulfolutivibrio sulfodismutans DSM 3696]